MLDMALPCRVEVVETTRVTPSFDSSKSTTQFSLPLTYFDTIWFKFHPVERIFFYQLSDATPAYFNSVILPKLKHSLALTLVHYLPLAGNLRWPSDSPKPIIIYNPPDDGVWVTAAVSNSNFSVVSGNEVHEALELHYLVPQLLVTDDLAPIIALQITLFPFQGFCIGITSHHTGLDGKSSTMFIKSWAHFCNEISVLPPELTPFYDRNVIKDPTGLDLFYLNQWLDFTSSDSDPIRRRSLMIIQNIGDIPDDLVRATFELTREDIKKLREKVVSKLDEPKLLRLSSFVVTLSFISACLVKARGGDGDRKVLLSFAADGRSRLDPPIPENYFGNCVGGRLVIAKAGELMDENGFVYAAKLVSDMVNELEKGILEADAENKLTKILNMIKEAGLQCISVAGSPRFGVYGVDFGWGKPKKVEIPSIDRGGAISLAETRDGTGGIEIGLALTKHQMETFTSLFIGRHL